MTQPGIEPRSPGPLANTLTIWPMSTEQQQKNRLEDTKVLVRLEGEAQQAKTEMRGQDFFYL